MSYASAAEGEALRHGPVKKCRALSFLTGYKFSMNQIGAITELIDALKKLPGIGPRAAQRIAYQLLNGDRKDALTLGRALLCAAETVHRCPKCNNLTDGDFCSFCSAKNRDDTQLCVVESVADMMVIEQSLSFNGRYFVLLGRLSPLNGVGPLELGLDKLMSRCDDAALKEVVIATSFTPEGEATAAAISDLIGRHFDHLKITRIAKGVPAGAELEYTDVNTIAQAMLNRVIRETD